MKPLERNRQILELGRRALSYYEDTGCCVFCNADDVEGIPHENCDVGKVAGVDLTPERRELKRAQRDLMSRFQDGTLTRGELQAFSERWGTVISPPESS